MTAATLAPPAPQQRRRIRPRRVVLYTAMCIIAVFYIFPVYLLVITALKSFDQVSLSRMWDLPTSISFASFDRAWNGGQGTIGMRGSFLNSILMVVPATVISRIGSHPAEQRPVEAGWYRILVVHGMRRPSRVWADAGEAVQPEASL